jgi:hypothetical protein
VLKKGEALACFRPVDQEPDADAAKEDFVAACWPDDLRTCRSSLYTESFPWTLAVAGTIGRDQASLRNTGAADCAAAQAVI